ncbi:FecR family protein [Sphingomonas qilianensis]|uniref:FecR domain-containing protein n=1 Tax=Sphingomonas qilianensis TaxID=1736690 RepID=A0ABU9XSV7_9SPHN
MTDPIDAAETGAAQWDAKLRGARTSPHDRQAFAAWLDTHPENRAAHGRLQSALATLRAHADQDLLSALREEARGNVQRAARRRFALLVASAAAVLLLCIGITMRFDRGVATAEGPVTETMLATAATQRTKVTLADRSVITLDAGTQLTVRLGATRREVKLLSGRALFEVAKDPQRPFIVMAKGRTITALGTRFDVSLSSRELRVTLAEGAVAVRPARQRAGIEQQILKPRQQFIERIGAAGPTLRFIDADRALSWTAGKVYFEDEPLAIAVEEMNRNASVEIVVDPTAANLRINGMFRTSNQTGFLEALELTLPVEVRRDYRGRIRVVALHLARHQ